MTRHGQRRAWQAIVLVLASMLLTACQQAAPPVPAPAAPSSGTTASAAPASTSAEPAVAAPSTIRLPSRDFPPGPLYLCEVAGQKTPIDYGERVASLCRKHPEMGPCQYERDQCRARGGRVYTQKGEEVTRAVENEYDKMVRRVRFQADDGKKPRSR